VLRFGGTPIRHHQEGGDGWRAVGYWGEEGFTKKDGKDGREFTYCTLGDPLDLDRF